MQPEAVSIAAGVRWKQLNRSLSLASMKVSVTTARRMKRFDLFRH